MKVGRNIAAQSSNYLIIFIHKASIERMKEPGQILLSNSLPPFQKHHWNMNEYYTMSSLSHLTCDSNFDENLDTARFIWPLKLHWIRPCCCSWIIWPLKLHSSA